MSVNEPTPSPVRRRRRLVLPAAAAALALGVVGAGAGYAAVQHGAETTTTAPSTSGSTSSQLLPPGYGYGGGYGYRGGYGGGSSAPGSTDTTRQAFGSELTGLVRIVSTMAYDGGVAAGTGMILSSDGEVVTNHHVVEGATGVQVTVMSTGTTYDAKVVGADATDDVAVLQLEDASGLDTVSTDTGSVGRGDRVTAVGDGNGTVDHLSAATGTVVATDQPITTQSEGSAAGDNLTGLIEISSDVVGGYSGGATYDGDGEVIGMTTAASSGTSDIVGYAIPIAKVLGIVDDLDSGTTGSGYDYGYPAFLGIGLGPGEATTVQGVYDGTPAADAGIGAGDTITSIEGTGTPTAAALRSAMAAHEPGDQVRITWTDASGSSHTAVVTLAEGPVA